MAVKNANLDYSSKSSEPVSYEKHKEWWEQIFDKEHMYVIIYDSEVCGYIRFTKMETKSKEKNEISIALLKKFQNKGLGTFAYEYFEKEMAKYGITEIIAVTNIKNNMGQRFFEKNKFEKTQNKENYIRYIKKL